MNNRPDNDNPPSNPHLQHDLGKIPGGAFDTELEPPSAGTSKAAHAPEPVKGLGSLRREAGASKGKGPSPSPSPSVLPTASGAAGHTVPTPRPGEDRLQLPDGALVAMRKSGGLRFTSRTVVVYANGQVATDDAVQPGSAGPAQARKLADADLAALYRALNGANFPQLPATSGRQNPDAFAYELAARAGSAAYSVEVFDGSVPAQLTPLIHLLTDYMRPPD